MSTLRDNSFKQEMIYSDLEIDSDNDSCKIFKEDLVIDECDLVADNEPRIQKVLTPYFSKVNQLLSNKGSIKSIDKQKLIELFEKVRPSVRNSEKIPISKQSS